MTGEHMSGTSKSTSTTPAGEREWPSKTVHRKRGELREFIEIAGDKPVNTYRQE